MGEVREPVELDELFAVPPPTQMDASGRWRARIPQCRPPCLGTALLRILRANPCVAFTAGQLAERLGMASTVSIRKRLSILVREGTIERACWGRYVARPF